MASLRDMIAQGRIFFRRPDWGPDEFVHAVWALQGRDNTLTDICLCHAPPGFEERLLNDDQWEPGAPPGLEAAVEIVELPLPMDTPFWQVGKPMEA